MVVLIVLRIWTIFYTIFTELSIVVIILLLLQNLVTITLKLQQDYT